MSDLLALAVGKDNPEYPPPPFLRSRSSKLKQIETLSEMDQSEVL